MKVRELNKVLEECCFSECISGKEIDLIGGSDLKLLINMAKNMLEDVSSGTVENTTSSLTNAIRCIAIALFLHKE